MKEVTPHQFKCETCGLKVKRPGHLILRDQVCYKCRAVK